jgi:hypothetical protein
MCFLFSLLPATILAVLGYIVLYCSAKSDGAVRTFGRILCIWVFILAAFPPLVGAYVTIAGYCSLEAMHRLPAQK